MMLRENNELMGLGLGLGMGMSMGCRKMGSLPNLHELERIRRTLENENEMAKREQRAREERETSRIDRDPEPEKIPPMLIHPSHFSYNSQFCGSHHVGGTGTTTAASTTTTIGGSFGITAGGSHIGGFGILGFGTPGQIPKQQHYHHQHHRHSLTTRHRVLRTRSSGATYNIWDDPMIEMSAYSPISSRSHRITQIPPSYQIPTFTNTNTNTANNVNNYRQQHQQQLQHRESINSSSIDANSIRRLVSLKNHHYHHQQHQNYRYQIPINIHNKFYKKFIYLMITHCLICSIIIPICCLQTSNTIWYLAATTTPQITKYFININWYNIGSLLFSLTFFITFVMCFMMKFLLKKFHYILIIGLNYISILIFLLSHLYPKIYILLPSYILLGITIGPSLICKIILIIIFSNKLNLTNQQLLLDNNNILLINNQQQILIDNLDIDMKLMINRDEKIRRLIRFYQLAQDLGIIFGAILASVILTCSLQNSKCFLNFLTNFHQKYQPSTNLKIYNLNNSNSNYEDENLSNLTINFKNNYEYLMYNNYENDIYKHNEYGERICGADLCTITSTVSVLPALNENSSSISDTSLQNEYINQNHYILIGIYVILIIIALVILIFVGQIDIQYQRNSNDRVKNQNIYDTILYCGLLAYFIGTEQAYILGDFMRAYVSCTLGLQMVAGTLIGMGIMQAIVSCTLSMLLRHTKRIIVIAAGFFFHSCLLLVLSQWKPSKDDSALFYVIAASWGACNAMWETLLLALLTLTHSNNIIDIIIPIQGIRFLGLAITFAVHSFLCENIKILILGIILVLSVPPYAIYEIRLEQQRKQQLLTL